MGHVLAYHRPAELGEALTLLARPGVPTAVLAGGTSFNARRPGVAAPAVEVVDLQALGLDGIEPVGGAPGATSLRLGAMARLDDLVHDERVPAVLRELARRELPSTLRTLATVGGTVVAGGWESELLAGLLAHDAVVEIAVTGSGVRELPLADLLGAPGGLHGRVVTSVTVATDGVGAAARTGRTPGDVPIVAAVAHRDTGGRVRVAMSGVAPTPVLVDDPSSLQPPGDFRGSTEYRRTVAAVLFDRVRTEVQP